VQPPAVGAHDAEAEPVDRRRLAALRQPPNARSTRPPTVSNSSSENSLPKRALKSAISVCAFTR
jgi:hypothetical protein